MRQAVEKLLAEDARAGSFLQHPAFDFLDKTIIGGFPTAETNHITNGVEIPLSRSLEPRQVLIDGFVIVRLIAKGGMGEVYEAEDRMLQGVHIALKTILPHVADEPALQKRFEREVLLAREAVHPNLCPIYDIFYSDRQTPNFLFLTMKLLPGGDPRSTIAETFPDIAGGRIGNPETDGAGIGRDPRCRNLAAQLIPTLTCTIQKSYSLFARQIQCRSK